MAGPLVRAGDVRDPLDVAIAEVGIVDEQLSLHIGESPAVPGPIRGGSVVMPIPSAVLVVVIAIGVSILGDAGAICVDNRVILD